MQIKFSEFINDNKDLTPKKKNLLIAFLLHEMADTARQFWPANRTFYMKHEGKTVSFSFDRNLLWRRRKEGRPGLRFEVFGAKHFAKGGIGVVYRTASIKITMTDDFSGYAFSMEHKTRLMKRSVFATEKELASVSNEHHCMEPSGHLGSKPPTFVYSENDGYWHSFLTMKIMPGEELYNVFERSIDRPRILSYEDRFIISLEALKKAKTQVVDHGIIHRDLRLCNFMAHKEGYAPYELNVIDYGLAVHKTAEEKALNGQIQGSHSVLTDPQLDIMDLGVLLRSLWRPTIKTLEPENLRNKLWRLISHMAKGFNVIQIDPSKASPREWPAIQLSDTMRSRHGFIQQGTKLYFVNSHMLIKLISSEYTQSLCGKLLDQLEPLNTDQLLGIEVRTGFVPPEPIRREQMDLDNCIQELEQIFSDYQKSPSKEGPPQAHVPDKAAKVPVPEVRALPEEQKQGSKKAKDYSKELQLREAMDNVGFFASRWLPPSKFAKLVQQTPQTERPVSTPSLGT